MLQNIVKQFFPYQNIVEIKAFGGGHINDTYKLELEYIKTQYILQRINTDVFKNPKEIISTHRRLQEHFECAEKNSICIANVIPTSNGDYLYTDEQGGAWRMTNYIQDSYTVDVVQEQWQAFEAGNAFGWFVKECSDLNVAEFKESIIDFHKLSFRLQQLNEAIENNAAERLDKIQEVVDFFKKREASLSEIEQLTEAGEIPLRIVHNDTKINNLLFKGQKAAAVIDLDTVGPGILFFDYGDALRTGANTAVEDEKDLTKVQFNLEAFEWFTKGYLQQTKEIITPKEKEFLHKAPILMTYIIGIRFLTDYLNGDKYYKVAYPEHNLTRTLVQKALIESIEQNKQKIVEIINECTRPTELSV